MEIAKFKRTVAVCCFIAEVLFMPSATAKVAEATADSSVSYHDRPSLRLRSVRRIGWHRGYSVDVRYPQFIGSSKEIVRLNRAVRRLIDMNISAQPGSNCSYTADYEPCLVNSRFVSLKFNFSDYLGGATTFDSVVTLNIQLYPNFKLLKLSDLLGKKVNYSKLSNLCANQLEELSSKGLKVAEFSNFTFSKKDLTFYMANGPASANQDSPATISYKQLKSLVGTRSPIRYVSRSLTCAETGATAKRRR